MMFLNQINFANYWKRMLECSKNIFNEISITLLELKIIFQNCEELFEKLHDLLLFPITKTKLFDTVVCKVNQIILILKNWYGYLSFLIIFLNNQHNCLNRNNSKARTTIKWSVHIPLLWTIETRFHRNEAQS
jgi:hypothetical protein